MGSDTPKQFMKVRGHTILEHTLNKFINYSSLKDIVIVMVEDRLSTYDAIKHQASNCRIINGSNTRKSSVYNGLQSFVNVKNESIILVHDAARPLIDTKDIEAILKVMQNPNIVAATLATPVVDSLLKDDKTVKRKDMWAVQTPQAFRFGALKDAHEKFKDDNSFTDDASLVRAAGHNVEIVPASRDNIKITTPDDLEFFRKMLNNETETRSAMGYDVHAFENEPSDRKLMLGGIEIGHPLALTGHSDADVVLHAITDAILGAINQGDIGTHFPPSDPQWKDCDSAFFLEESYKLLLNNNGVLNFVDVTIMAEEPKIGPHREVMQARIADILQISANRISIKATTTEKLGFTGRKEGIACHAVVLITS
jgi:2-C-methyl-D-erythritol 4-phosphate cytidylyltransferase/2-C-methyl-D-erythritol 2,4-cyclodiphosphate synthase